MRKLSYLLTFASFVALAGLTTSPDFVYAQAGTWGKSVKGQVVFAGAKAPEPLVLNVNKDQQHCLGNGPLVSEEWVINPTSKGIKNVFVWITTESGAKPPINAALTQIQNKNVDLDQPVCAFVPHALAVREGQTLVVNNSAPVAHNVNWAGGRAKNPGGNVIVPPGNKHQVSNLKADKDPVSVTCNIHSWMKGWIRVFDHPYYAVTDADGKFDIKMPPAGKYQIWYWHDTGWRNGAAGNKGFPIDIKANADTDLGKVEWKPAG